MLSLLLVSMGVFGVLFLLLGIGVIMGRGQPRGSCGGLGGKSSCELCGGETCEKEGATGEGRGSA